MAKIKIPFNGTSFNIEESTLSEAKSILQSHLSSNMTGSGAVIKLGGVSYNIDSSKLNAAGDIFEAYLDEVSGDELVEEELAPGLYSNGVLAKSWDELLGESCLRINDGTLYALDFSLEGDLVISNNITSIGNWAFSFCGLLTSVSIPDSVTTIGDSAFDVCGSLTSITIPASVTSIGTTVFNGCSSLTGINFTGTLSQWETLTQGNLSWAGTTLSYVQCSDGIFPL